MLHVAHFVSNIWHLFSFLVSTWRISSNTWQLLDMNRRHIVAALFSLLLTGVTPRDRQCKAMSCFVSFRQSCVIICQVRTCFVRRSRQSTLVNSLGAQPIEARGFSRIRYFPNKTVRIFNGFCQPARLHKFEKLPKVYTIAPSTQVLV